MNRSTEQLKDWLGRVRRIVKKAANAGGEDDSRWCPANSEGVQMELQLGVEVIDRPLVKMKRRAK
jgi:hypothetical protein